MSMFGDPRCTFKSLVHGNYKSLDEYSLVWPPMLFVCMHEDDFLTKESEDLRRWLVNKNQIDIVKHIPRVCSEGYAVWDLFILPPTRAAFAAALAMDEWTFMEAAYRCVYASVRDIWDIKAGRIPESSRRDLGLLRYCGMRREKWVGLHVELLGDDGTCVGQGVCKASQPKDYFHDAILGDSHVGVSMTTSESLEADDGSSSAINRRWKATHVLFEDVSLSQRLDQYVKSQDPHEREQMEWMSPRGSKLVPKSKINEALSSEECLKSLVPLVCGSEICDSLAGDSRFSDVRTNPSSSKNYQSHSQNSYGVLYRDFPSVGFHP